MQIGGIGSSGRSLSWTELSLQIHHAPCGGRQALIYSREIEGGDGVYAGILTTYYIVLHGHP